MTYLSQFPNAKLAANAPIRQKTDAKKARAYGKGVEPQGNKVKYYIFIVKLYYFLQKIS